MDAVYRRLEGEKALYRLLGETEGVFSFASGGAGQSLRRIVLPTQSLLLEGMRHIDEARARREALDSEEDAFLAIVPAETAKREAEQRVLEVLLAPRTLTELLDEVPLADLDVLEALSALLDNGQVRRIAAGAERVELADSERLTVLAALAKRAARAGFRAPARVAIAASPQRLATLTHAVSRIADAMVPTETVPSAPIPHALATLRLADGGELGVVGPAFGGGRMHRFGRSFCQAAPRLRVWMRRQRTCSKLPAPMLVSRWWTRPRCCPRAQKAIPEQVAGCLRLLLERAAGG